jgi:hypothetical protein
MFATLILDKEPLRLEQVPGLVHGWLLAVGGFAAAGLALWLLMTLVRGPGPNRDENTWSWSKVALVILAGGFLFAALPPCLTALWNTLGWSDPADPTASQGLGTLLFKELRIWEFLAGCALAAVLLPVGLNLSRMRARRIFALAKLSFKEAIRRRVLWVFSLLLLVFLFASWFIDTTKTEDQLRNYVTVVYMVMTILLLVTTGILASFSIPADLRNQTIHTIVTKPVERFEIILGRFLGYSFLMTLVLAVMTLFSLVYVARGIDQEAADESYKARVPVYGKLDRVGAVNVGYEFEYRQFISVPDNPEDDKYALWKFANLPSDLGQRSGQETVPCEFTFEIFRTTKGEENKGIYCSFVFENWKCKDGKKPGVPAQLEEYRKERNDLLKQAAVDGKLTMAAINNQLAEKYGFHEILSKEIVDFHTLSVDVPASLFKNRSDWLALPPPRPPQFQVVVRCESKTQYLGVAQYDLYLLDDTRLFEPNFFKGAVGLWYRLLLVTGLAVTCSTYLSGVIAFLSTMFLYVAGLILDFITQVALGQAMGGGPLEAFYRLSRREHPTIPLDPQGQSPVLAVVQGTDKVFQFLLQLFTHLIPDVDRFDLTNFVAEGFDISGMHLFLTGVLFAGYLLPWIVLAYYLIRSREVAA